MSSVARGPAGPPPRGAPMAALKPPPMAPPRGPNVTQRPPVETIKAIQPRPMGAPPSAGAPTGPPRGAGAPRQPPPRPGGPPPFAEHIPDDTDDASRINTGPMVRGMAPPKFSQAARPAAPPKKAGAIAMFRPPDPSIEPADKKMRLDEQPGAGRQPRPAPPRPQPPGIPSGQPMPPTQKPNDGSKPPAPTHPAPNRNRAPPKVVEKPKPGERPKERIVAPDPPTTEPPFKRGLKVKEEEVVFVPRRERENPEFESSSSEEEDEPVQPKSKDPFAAIKPKEETESVAPSVEEEKPKLAAVSKEPVTPEVKVKVIGDEEFQDMDETEIPGASAVSIAETFDTRETEDDGVVVAPVVAPSIGMPPQVGVTHDNTMSSYVPPAPQEFVPQNVDSTLSRDLNGGRFSIRCIEGINIRRKDDTSAQPRTDPFIKFKLGAAERFPWQNTGIKRKQDQNPNFGNEVVAFNMLNPGQYVFLDDVQLTIEVWNKSPFKDELMGAVTMSVVRILKSPYALFKETVPLFLPGLKQSNSKLVLEFVFEEARAGLFVITLFEAHGIRNIDPMGQQHPFINFHVGPSYSKKSKVVKDGKSDPYFGEEEILIWADNENWIHDINFDMCDENVGVEKPICSSSLSMLPYMNMEAGEAKQDEFDLFYYIQTDPKDDREKREVASGVLMMRVEFLQAGQLSVLCTKGKNLQFPESHHTAGDDLRMDPYCNLSLDGQAVKIVKRTPVDKDGGHDPVWNHEIKFNVVDQYLVDLDVYHQNMQGNDVLLGYTQISLLPIFRNGRSEFWVTLKQQKITGGVIEVGAVHLSFTFKATPGVAFPRHRTDVDVFDDTVRKLPPPAKDIEEDDVIEVKPEISTIPDEESSVVDREDSPTKDRFGEETQEFSDAEIIAAFKFIDLDHNNFVGASEIRHILVCMGEMITGKR